MAQLKIAVSEKDHIRGNSNAPVTLVEYGDYECPHCGMAYPIVKSIQRRLGKKLRFVFRNFPLAEAHPHARHAAGARVDFRHTLLADGPDCAATRSQIELRNREPLTRNAFVQLAALIAVIFCAVCLRAAQAPTVSHHDATRADFDRLM